MRAVLILLMAVVGRSAALWDCPFEREDLPSYQQVTQEVLASLNTSKPKDLLVFGQVHTESIDLLQCANTSPDLRFSGTPVLYFQPTLWPNKTVYYNISRSEFSPVAVARLEEEIKYVNDHTCVSFVEKICLVNENCVVIQPTTEIVKRYMPPGCPPDDYGVIYHVARASELVEQFGFLDWIMWILGFMPDHNRYDRDKYLLIQAANQYADLDWMKMYFLKNMQTIVHTVFPYDPQSALHMTIDFALYYNVDLSTLSPEHVIKQKPDGLLSPIDIQKIHYYYCHETLTYPVSSIPPELLHPTDTTALDSTELPEAATEFETTTPEPETTASTTTTAAPPTTTTTTTDEMTTMTETTTSTTADPRFTLAMKFDDLDESSNTTTTSSTTTTAATTKTATATEPTTTAFPMTSSGVCVTDHSFLKMLESALLLVGMVTYWVR